jgi:hypothetical protein
MILAIDGRNKRHLYKIPIQLDCTRA